MGKIAIIADGSIVAGNDQKADLVVPFQVIYEAEKGHTSVLSGQELDQEKFLLIQQGCRKPPTTAAPSLGHFIQAYENLYTQGYREFLVLAVSERFSATLSVARKAFEIFDKDHQEVVIRSLDTGTTAAGIKYLAEEAAKARAEGVCLEQIAERLERLKKKIEIFVALDSLQYIAASGRIEGLAQHQLAETAKRYAKGAVAKLVTLAHKSPKIVLSVRDGQDKIIGFSLNFSSAVSKMTDTIGQREFVQEIRRCYLYQSQALEEARKIPHRLNYDRSEKALNKVEIVEECEIPIALLAVTGPKLVAAVCVYE